MKLLYVDGCISQRGERSRTQALAQAFLAAFRAGHPDDEVETVNVDRLRLRPFSQLTLDDRDALIAVGAFDAPVFALARQFQAADRVVVAAPLWDLTFPAVVRIYMEYISVRGLTYHYDGAGCHGDCAAKRLAYLSTAGDFAASGGLGAEYWRQLAALFGIPQFDAVVADGLDAEPERAAELLQNACTAARRLARDF